MSIYSESVASRDNAISRLNSAAKAVGHMPGRGMVGISNAAQALRPGFDRIALEIKLKQGKTVGLVPDRIRELGLESAIDAKPIVDQFLKGVEPSDRVRAIHAQADQIRAEYGHATKGQVLTSDFLDANSLRELGDILS
jgi:hypothetical protein